MTEQEILNRMADSISLALFESHGFASSQPLKEAAEAAYEVVREMIPQWLPIEDAPMDGTHIYLFNGKCGIGYYWKLDRGEAAEFLNETDYAEFLRETDYPDFWTWGDEGFECENPTHWMHLPLPPEAT